MQRFRALYPTRHTTRKCDLCDGAGWTSEAVSEAYGSKGKAEGESRQLSGSVCTAWDKFPTESPVCSGDDGIPTGLSGITVSKHRTESLKAYGNAIVHQIAIEFFKAIKIMYEKR